MLLVQYNLSSQSELQINICERGNEHAGAEKYG